MTDIESVNIGDPVVVRYSSSESRSDYDEIGLDYNPDYIDPIVRIGWLTDITEDSYIIASDGMTMEFPKETSSVKQDCEMENGLQETDKDLEDYYYITPMTEDVMKYIVGVVQDTMTRFLSGKENMKYDTIYKIFNIVTK